jgi:SAM-dependent methyltransferase
MTPPAQSPAPSEVSLDAPTGDAANCPLCGGRFVLHLRNVQDPLTRHAFGLLRCNACGLQRTHPVPADLAPYYAEYHGARHGATARFCLRRRIRFLHDATRNRRPGFLLDIGCGDGSFLLAARERGWQVMGTEFNPQLARHHGISVVTDLNAIHNSAVFNCITLWHSLEHLSDPLAAMKRIRSLLAPDGVLLIAVPNSAGLQASLFGRRWFHLDVPRHLYHFSQPSLTALLQSTGFSPVGWHHQEFEYDLLGWPQSALNCLLSTPNVFFQQLTGRTPQCSTTEKFVSYVGGLTLTALAMPLVALGTALHRGGTLVVAARPVR